MRLVHLFVFLWLALPLCADPRVSVVSSARADYTQRKFGGSQPVKETYVFMQGSYFEGATVDRSIERMTFRRIAEMVARHLARQNYLPTNNPKEADLAIVVHWGTTLPYITTQTMAGSTTAVDRSRTMSELQSALDAGTVAGDDRWAGLPTEADNQLDFDRLNQAADQLGAHMHQASNVQLLGYGDALREASKSIFGSAEEQSLRFDLVMERYFIILKAYELRHRPPPGQKQRALWTVHLNMGTPGVNFGEALARMSDAAPEFVGRTTDRVKTIKRPPPKVTVELQPLIILGEVK